MAKVTFKRYETDAEAQASNIVDGQFIVTKEGTSYIDYGTDRIPTNGTPDTAMSNTSQSTVQNKVIKEYVDDTAETVKEYVDAKQTYSTTETVIGTYNNKPLYRKTFIGTYANNSVLASNVAVLVNAYGSGKHEGSNNARTVPYYEYWNGTTFILTVNMPNNDTDVVLSSKFQDVNVSANINITLEYTKTTD